MSKNPKQQQLSDYFKTQDKYIGYLINKFGENYRCTKSGCHLIKTYSSCHDAWDYLSDLERSLNIRKIALMCSNNDNVSLLMRCGESYMNAKTNNDIFPFVKITSYENDIAYGKKDIGCVIQLWKFNETISINKGE